MHGETGTVTHFRSNNRERRHKNYIVLESMACMYYKKKKKNYNYINLLLLLINFIMTDCFVAKKKKHW